LEVHNTYAPAHYIVATNTLFDLPNGLHYVGGMDLSGPLPRTGTGPIPIKEAQKYQKWRATQDPNRRA
jgi:hypothetical protein